MSVVKMYSVGRIIMVKGEPYLKVYPTKESAEKDADNGKYPVYELEFVKTKKGKYSDEE